VEAAAQKVEACAVVRVAAFARVLAFGVARPSPVHCHYLQRPRNLDNHCCTAAEVCLGVLSPLLHSAVPLALPDVAVAE